MEFNNGSETAICKFMETKKYPKLELLFLDVEKAFDNLSWKFMLLLLEKMKMGENYLNAIKTIYGEQEANLIINSDSTTFFSLKKGTRQGCPCHPYYLF